MADNVRAELARKGIKISHLGGLIGQNTAYWGRRDRGQLPYDSEDLIAIAHLLRINAGVFFLGTEEPPAGDDERLLSVRRQGLEPRTRYISASASQSGIAEIVFPELHPGDDDNHEGCDVVDLPVWRNRPGVTKAPR